MVKVNFNDGSTLEFDLNKEDDQKQWEEWTAVKDFQDRITGIGILHSKKFHTLPFPKRFKKVRFFAESVFSTKKGIRRKLGEKVVIHADEIVLELLVYTFENPPPPIQSRTTMLRLGKQMFPEVAIEKVNERINNERE